MKHDNTPLVYVVGGVVIALVFLAFLISGVPQGGSIIPPVGLAIGVLIAISALVVWLRRRGQK
jgi:tryptophan-rich sensory protein